MVWTGQESAVRRRRPPLESWTNARRSYRKLPDQVVDELLAGARTRRRSSGPGGLLSQLTKRLVKRALEVELTDHVGSDRDWGPSGGAGNTRNGSASNTLITEHWPLPVRHASGAGAGRKFDTRSRSATEIHEKPQCAAHADHLARLIPRGGKSVKPNFTRLRFADAARRVTLALTPVAVAAHRR